MNFVGILFLFICIVLPELVSLFCLVISALITWRSRSLFSGCLTLVIFATVLWSLFIWCQIFLLQIFSPGRLPVLLNWIGIGVFIGQLLWFNKRKPFI
jgi:hypothetical protein